jgi:hypothetical protein
MIRIELLLIGALLIPQAAESVQRHWRPFRNWMDRRRAHRAWGNTQ